MIEAIQKYIPYELTLIISILTPLFIIFYRAWIKSKFDKKLEVVKGEFQKELQKHDIRLNHYKEFYKKLDELNVEIQKHSESISNEISLKSQNLSSEKGLSEALNYENYIDNLKTINQLIFDSIQKIRREANEFRFYASDTILKYLDELDIKYESYLNELMNQDFGLLQKAFDLVKNGDFDGLLSFMKNPEISKQQLTMNISIGNLHSKIKDQMRTELNLKK
jgi:hypothetical protein